uniref:SSD domain-containing protein n=1 Tax=Meloidogyne enterolobii TaxID=390850 RepID=A0A6V7Y7T5_MELEN|nr:unnamed protein product [Meloidogyne enterolobii]
MLPFIIVGFVIMLCCSSVFVLLSASYMNQFNFKRLWLALMACLCPLMASGTAFSTISPPKIKAGIYRQRFYPVFKKYLLIGDYVFSYLNIFKILDQLVLVDTGPAILISALTKFCADAIGSFTGSPEITLLCMGSMAAITVDFIYQVTFYAAL